MICLFICELKLKIVIMTRNGELIEKYNRYIKKMERELKETKDDKRIIYLEGKISVYKMVIIDLQE